MRLYEKRPLTAVFTIGHSTKKIGEFIDLLRKYGVKQLIDVRTMPGSAYNPQFNRARLSASLKKAGIRYRHMPLLGGLRKPEKESKNAGWRNASFRGFADYMQTKNFSAGLKELIRLSAIRQTVIMCAEAVPWRCHRNLIADALAARGIKVIHILGAKSMRSHELTPFASVLHGKVSYPGSAKRGP